MSISNIYQKPFFLECVPPNVKLKKVIILFVTKVYILIAKKMKEMGSKIKIQNFHFFYSFFAYHKQKKHGERTNPKF